MVLTRLGIVINLFLLLAMAGCDSGPKVVPISGTLMRQGKPVPNLFINFEPDKGRPSWGLADANGKFTLKYDDKLDGAAVGPHTVWVVWRPANPKEELVAQGVEKGKTSKPADMKDIAAKFGSKAKSPLKIQVTKAESNLELKLD